MGGSPDGNQRDDPANSGAARHLVWPFGHYLYYVARTRCLWPGARICAAHNQGGKNDMTGDEAEKGTASPASAATDHRIEGTQSNDGADGGRDLKAGFPPAAQRALAEAEQRRRLALRNETVKTSEIGGRDGPDPVRYGDWEKGGIASDF